MSSHGRIPGGVSTRKPSLVARVCTQIFVLIFCVGIPALLTGVAPVSWVTFERVPSGLESGGSLPDSRITASVRVCTFFIIPYRRFFVPDVTRIGKTHRPGRKKAEAEAHLVIISPDEERHVLVSPADIESVIQKVEAFRADPTERQLSFAAVANWKFGVLGGGLASLLTVLYLVGILIGIGRGITRSAGYATAPRHRPA